LGVNHDSALLNDCIKGKLLHIRKKNSYFKHSARHNIIKNNDDDCDDVHDGRDGIWVFQ